VPGDTSEVNDEMWVIMNTGEWIESGVGTGLTSIPGVVNALPTFFVAFNRAGPAGWYEWDSGVTTPLNQWEYNIIAKSSSPNTWAAISPANSDVWGSGFANNYAAVQAETGIETTGASNRIAAAATDLGYEPWNGGAWQSGWGTPQYPVSAQHQDAGIWGLYFSQGTLQGQTIYGYGQTPNC
jgi:hypothetical protein